MYSTCVVCNRNLGANEALEQFPVGRRLAFDADKGRLWVVCPHCGRWNLSPFEERWEAIESAERLFRSTRLRMSTDNIGLARLPDGTDLVRVGKPLRPELAAWRYGSRFASRRNRQLVRGGILAAGIGAAGLLLPAAALPMLVPAMIAPVVIGALSKATGAPVLFRDRYLKDEEGLYLRVTNNEIGNIRLVRDGEGWGLKVPYEMRYRDFSTLHFTDMIRRGANREALLKGDVAIEAARTLLPLVNGTGARSGTVTDAVNLVAQWDDADHAFTYASQRVHEWAAKQSWGDTGALSFLPDPVRLALEMSAYEDQERLALEGELSELERAWREAEEVAAIADDLLIPNPVMRALGKMKRGIR